MRVLVVEDEKQISAFIKRGLEEESYAVDVAADGEEGLNWLESFSYDLVITDILMPKMDGITFCKIIRDRGLEVPVLMLTARDTVDDRVTGLDAGADDYLVKPFAFRELLARLRAISRRHREEKTSSLVVEDLELNLITRQLTRKGQEIQLTNKEFALLEFLMRNPGKILTRTVIGEHIWDYNFFNQSNIVDVYIRQLRKKIDEPFGSNLIRTIRGSGYKIQGG